MVRRSALAVWSSVVTHEDIRDQVAPYAAGEVAAPVAEAVRAHLASGCPDCLRMLYAERSRAARRLPRRQGPGRWGPIGGAVLGVGLGVLAAMGIGVALRQAGDPLKFIGVPPGSRGGGAAPEHIRARLERELADAGAARTRVEAELARLQSEITRLRAEADEGKRREEDAAVPPVEGAEGSGALKEALAASERHAAVLAREVRTREAELERLRVKRRSAAALEDLLKTPGLRLVALRPAPGLREPYGHALLAPGATSVVLSIEGAPLRAVAFRVRLFDASGDILRVEEVQPSGGALFAHVRLAQPADVARIEVLREPGDELMLLGSVTR